MKHSFIDQYVMDGHLEIIKIYKDGREEVHFDSHNIIVSGMGVGLSFLFSRLGSPTITDYQIDRFQVGVSGGSENEVSSTFQLSGPLSSIAEYGTNNINLLLTSANAVENGAIGSTDKIFAMIPHSHVTRIDNRGVRYTFLLDDNTANDLTRLNVEVNLSEVGLFMKNPWNIEAGVVHPILVAYRAFSPIHKTSDFSLLFRWTLRF
jgi:hypothetical protein